MKHMTVAARLVGDDFSITLGAFAFNGLPMSYIQTPL